MADIEHIKLNGDTYDIADAQARENVEAESKAREEADTTLQASVDKVKSHVNNLTFTINSDDLGLDITVD